MSTAHDRYSRLLCIIKGGAIFIGTLPPTRITILLFTSQGDLPELVDADTNHYDSKEGQRSYP